MVTGPSSLSSYDLVFHNGSKSHLAYVDATFTFEGVVYHSTAFTRAYHNALIHYLVPLELDHVDHTTTTTSTKTKVVKVDLNIGKQRIWPYQHGQQSVQLPPTW